MLRDNLNKIISNFFVMPDRNSRWETVCVLFVLAVLCFLAYGNMLGNELKVDDYTFYSDEFAQRFQSWQDFFTKLPDSRHYFPLNYMIMMGLFHLMGQGPFLLYSINLILFYLNCVLLWQLAVLLTKNTRVAFLTSVLFCVHPINSVVVNQSTLCTILVYALLMELSIITFCFSLGSEGESSGKKKILFTISLLVFVGSLLIFEGALLMSFFIMNILFFIQRYPLGEVIRRSLPFIFISFLYFLIWVMLVLRSDFNFAHKINAIDFTAGNYWASMAYLMKWYLVNFIYPVDVVWLKNIFPLKHFVWGWNVLSFASIVGVGVWVWRWGKARSLYGFALIWFLIGFSVMPLAMLGNPPLGFLIEPYWFYFSAIGAFLFMAFAVDHMHSRVNKRLNYIAVGIIICALLLQTRGFNAIAKTEESYCEFWLRSTPSNPIPMMILAKIHGNRQEYDQAMRYYQEILDTTGYHAYQVHNFMAVILMNKKEIKKAKDHILKALEVEPFYYKAYNTQGTLFVTENNYEQAEKSFLQAIHLSPTFTMAILNLVDLYFMTKQDGKAVDLLERSLLLRSPDSQGRSGMLVKLALLYLKQNNPKDFNRVVQLVLKVDKSGESVLSLSYLMHDMGFKHLALTLLSDAQLIYPQNIEICLFYGVMLCNENRFEEGIETWEKGLRLAPEDDRFREYIQKARILSLNV